MQGCDPSKKRNTQDGLHTHPGILSGIHCLNRVNEPRKQAVVLPGKERFEIRDAEDSRTKPTGYQTGGRFREKGL